jgi:hypothetical protein
VDRIDPDEYAIGAKQLLAHLVREFLIVDGWLGMYADRSELLENAVEAVVRRRRVPARFEIATPKNCDFKPLSSAIIGSFKKGRCRLVGASA